MQYPSTGAIIEHENDFGVSFLRWPRAQAPENFVVERPVPERPLFEFVFYNEGFEDEDEDEEEFSIDDDQGELVPTEDWLAVCARFEGRVSVKLLWEYRGREPIYEKIVFESVNDLALYKLTYGVAHWEWEE